MKMDDIDEKPLKEAHQSLYDLSHILEEQNKLKMGIKQLGASSAPTAANKLEIMLKNMNEDNNFNDEIVHKDTTVQTEFVQDNYLNIIKDNNTSSHIPDYQMADFNSKNQNEHKFDSTNFISPSSEEILNILKIEDEIKIVLSSEVNYLRAELNNMKDQIFSVVHENNLLHNQLRKTAFSDLQSKNNKGPNHEAPNVNETLTNLTYELSDQIPIENFKLHHWQKELQKLSKLHSNKSTILTSQLSQTKDENKRLSEEIEKLRSRLRILETGDISISGLCIECSSRKAVVSIDSNGLRLQQIESLTKERNELSRNITLLQSSLKNMQLREESCYIQVKNAVDMTEQAHIEMTQAYIEREQIKSEYENLRSRFDDHLSQYEKRLKEDSSIMSEHNQVRIIQLKKLNDELLIKVAELEASVEKLSRERVILQTDLEILRSQMLAQQQEFNELLGSAKIRVTEANTTTHFQQKEVSHLKQQLNQTEEERHVERTRLKEEIESLVRRLHDAETYLLDSKKQLLDQQNLKLQMEQEIQFLKTEKDNLDKIVAEKLFAKQNRSDLREIETNALIDKLNNKFERTRNDLQENLRGHETLIKKLKIECKNLVFKLEEAITSYKKIKHRNLTLRANFKKQQALYEQTSEELTLQLKLQEKLRQQLHEKDRHQLEESSQKQRLLMKEANLQKEKDLLTKHVDYLQNQLVLPENKHFLKNYQTILLENQFENLNTSGDVNHPPMGAPT